ncbi:MAG: hypothetical protein H3Z53_11265 [archaeon]|nr:hypothetical protein [archaeon]MCP8314931.1 hypothetical protein [archaeon]
MIGRSTTRWATRSHYPGGWQAYPKRCKFCKRKCYDEYCKLCEYTLFQIDHIIELYLQGMPPEAMDSAVAEFDRIYYSNTSLRVFYNSACEAVRYAVISPNSMLDLVEPNFSAVPYPKIITILEESGIVSRRGEEIYAGELLKKLIRLRLSGYSFSSDEFSKQLRIIYSILTLTITRTLLHHEEFIPQIVMGIFRVISAHIMRNVNSEKVPKEILQSSWETGFKGMNRREVAHVEWDLLGLTPNTNPRLFADYDSDREQFISKECMLYYYEYIRDRIREREYERQRQGR